MMNSVSAPTFTFPTSSPIILVDSPRSEVTKTMQMAHCDPLQMLEKLLCGDDPFDIKPEVSRFEVAISGNSIDISTFEQCEEGPAPWDMITLGLTRPATPVQQQQQTPAPAPMPHLLAPPAPTWQMDAESAGSPGSADSDQMDYEEQSSSPTPSPAPTRKATAAHHPPQPATTTVSPRTKRKYSRQRPERCDYASDADFQGAYHAWRIHRDRNNKAVRKSRSQGSHRAKEN